MPSAGRPFTPEAITRLVAKGIGVVPVVLHTGVASLEADELPYPERMAVPWSTAEAVNTAHRGGHRVIAVGTTVVRALETAAGDDGAVVAYDGWTRPGDHPGRWRPRRGRDDHGVARAGLVPPVDAGSRRRSTLLRGLLRGGRLAQGFRWHEFGDTHLILP